MTHRKTLPRIAMALSMLAPAALAETPPAGSPTGAPATLAPATVLDLDDQPAIDRIAGRGGRVVYLGMLGRNRTYLAISGGIPERHQVFHLDPATGRSTFGETFDRDGHSVTARQLKDAVARYEDAVAGRPPPAYAEAPDEDPRPARAAKTLAIDRETFAADVASSLATFPVGKAGMPRVYLVTSPSCAPCHAAWDALRPMVTQGKVVVVVILAAPDRAEEPLAAAVLSQSATSLAWYSGVGSSSDQKLLPEPPQAGSRERKVVDGYVRMNTLFARDIGATALPVVAYEGPGGWRAEERPDMGAVVSALAARASERPARTTQGQGPGRRAE